MRSCRPLHFKWKTRDARADFGETGRKRQEAEVEKLRARPVDAVELKVQQGIKLFLLSFQISESAGRESDYDDNGR